MKETLKILIVEDEAITAESLRQNLQRLGYTVIGIANNALDAIDFLSNSNIDLAILDIQIQGKKNGIWLAEYIQEYHKIPFIFLTGFGDEHTAKKAIAKRPNGYLLKPFSKQNLMVTIEVALLNFAKSGITITNEDKESSVEFMFVKQKDIFVKVKVDEILFLESDRNYVNIHTNGERFTTRSTLSEIKKTLPSYFLQTHRSFIVNFRKIDAVKTSTISVCSFTIPLTNSYKPELMDFLNNN